jgi:hypothetical protein
VREESNLTWIYNLLVIKRIGEIFNISVILNFSQRQEDLADILDNVRWELYEVKESSKLSLILK